ncbi:hypothetical protein HXX76_010438 [Chlamydomonas incerta]|uniref:Uncharacterized protein n=1 Tax=Chlamydomonas incerta TaxID=51695 RepID=A0A835SJI0_CHLIN|nr:hypothetical protein HXX76_010438 [Chlamydomonas incerta]|eukprot:KAG2428288.1 hypothetical protein HXX76_010438 [Chlamydomonas incerta]
MKLVCSETAAALRDTYRLITLGKRHEDARDPHRAEEGWPGPVFVAHWGGPEPWRSVTVLQRERLLCLAASSGHAASLDAALAQSGCALKPAVLTAAASSGNLAGCERLLWDEGCSFHPDALQAAAEGGHIPVLQLLLSECREECDSYLGWAMEAAAKGGQLPALQFLLRACDQPQQSHIHAAAQGACAGGRLEILSWLQQTHGYSPRPEDVLAAARGGQAALLEQLLPPLLLPVVATAAAAASGSGTEMWAPQQQLRHQLLCSIIRDCPADVLASVYDSLADGWAPSIRWLAARLRAAGGGADGAEAAVAAVPPAVAAVPAAPVAARQRTEELVGQLGQWLAAAAGSPGRCWAAKLDFLCGRWEPDVAARVLRSAWGGGRAAEHATDQPDGLARLRHLRALGVLLLDPDSGLNPGLDLDAGMDSDPDLGLSAWQAAAESLLCSAAGRGRADVLAHLLPGDEGGEEAGGGGAGGGGADGGGAGGGGAGGGEAGGGVWLRRVQLAARAVDPDFLRHWGLGWARAAGTAAAAEAAARQWAVLRLLRARGAGLAPRHVAAACEERLMGCQEAVAWLAEEAAAAVAASASAVAATAPAGGFGGGREAEDAEEWQRQRQRQQEAEAEAWAKAFASAARHGAALPLLRTLRRCGVAVDVVSVAMGGSEEALGWAAAELEAECGGAGGVQAHHVTDADGRRLHDVTHAGNGRALLRLMDRWCLLLPPPPPPEQQPPGSWLPDVCTAPPPPPTSSTGGSWRPDLAGVVRCLGGASFWQLQLWLELEGQELELVERGSRRRRRRQQQLEAAAREREATRRLAGWRRLLGLVRWERWVRLLGWPLDLVRRRARQRERARVEAAVAAEAADEAEAAEARLAVAQARRAALERSLGCVVSRPVVTPAGASATADGPPDARHRPVDGSSSCTAANTADGQQQSSQQPPADTTGRVEVLPHQYRWLEGQLAASDREVAQLRERAATIRAAAATVAAGCSRLQRGL